MTGRVCELFAGVGGFRLGLEKSGLEVVWSNQWEPGEKGQWASKCYISHFGEDGHTNKDIAKVPVSRIPDHELLVGGFPCQDYSVATSNAEGIHGKKGVLWWEIYRVLQKKKPPYVLLENVDRLLRSPARQRGRDFGIMLWCLNELRYVVEWRVLNAADYSGPQKRRRLFILGVRKGTDFAKSIVRTVDRHHFLQKSGFFATAFPVVQDLVRPLVPEPPHGRLYDDLQHLSDRYGFAFQNAGVMVSGEIWTSNVRAKPEPIVTLGSVLQNRVGTEFFVPERDVERWRYLKGAKAEPRRARTGFVYAYSEGAIPFPDALDQPSRTMVTGEGGLSPSRFKHLIQDPETKMYRVLTPVECERLNQFPDNWTDTGMPTTWRYFTMGNALVVGLVERMGRELSRRAKLRALEDERVALAPLPTAPVTSGQ